ncbi:hypothetical protein O181_014584 [Austropuccinia psidii MF-1]|uniref:Uncharacterized protein n=1 Tax=Austropuccinia psidii MF-1 TaxID=1389203 RepID=A0A9Q3BYD8_9BASI|nr:hypothetical protein [Austropuccinia psidii MF-1]
MQEDYAYQYENLNQLDGKLVHLEEWIYALQNKKWPNKLKIQLEDSNSEDGSPRIIHMPINKTEETFQILEDGNEIINGSPFKIEPKRKRVKFSENNGLTDEEIINEIAKRHQNCWIKRQKFKIHIPYQLLGQTIKLPRRTLLMETGNPKFIQKPPNENDETASILEHE